MNGEHKPGQNIPSSENAVTPPVSPQVHPTPASQPATTLPLNEVEERMSGFERSTLRLGRYGLGITILTGAFIALQWYEMHSGATDTRTLAESAKTTAESAKSQLVISEAQVKAMQAQVETIQKQTHVNERAWVGPNGVTWYMKPNEESKWTVIVVNSGKSPALHVHIDYMARSVFKGTPKDFTYEPLVESAIHSDTLLQPGMPLIVNSAKNPVISQTQFDKVRSGDLIAYIFGKIRYRDIFGDEHHTTFCLEMLRDAKTVGSCKEYNNAD